MNFPFDKLKQVCDHFGSLFSKETEKKAAPIAISNKNTFNLSDPRINSSINKTPKSSGSSSAGDNSNARDPGTVTKGY